MFVSLAAFLALLALTHEYNKTYSPSIKIRLTKEFDTRLKGFLRTLIEKYGTIDEGNVGEDGDFELGDMQEVRDEFKRMLVKSKKIFAAEVTVKKIEFVGRHVGYVLFMLIPGIILFVLNQLAIFESVKAYTDAHVGILKFMAKAECFANISIIILLIYYIALLLKAKNIKDGI